MLIPTKKNISTVTDLRINTIKLLKQLDEDGLRYVFQRSTPKAVMLSVDKYAALLERLEDYEDALLAQRLEKEDWGKGVSLEDMAKKYGVKL